MASDYKWFINEEVARNELGYVDHELELFRNGEMVLVFDREYYPSQISITLKPDLMSNQGLDDFEELKLFDNIIVTFEIDRSGYVTDIAMAGVLREIKEYEDFFGDSFRKSEGYLFEPNVADGFFDIYAIGVSAISKKVFSIDASKIYELHNSLCLVDFASLKSLLDSKYLVSDRVDEKKLIAALEIISGGNLTSLAAYRYNGRGVYLSCDQDQYLGTETLGLSYFDHTMRYLIDQEFKEYQEQKIRDILQ